MRGFRELLVWQKQMALVTRVYQIAPTFPKSELYGLVSQMQRAAVSVPSNIAEGHALKQSLAYTRHLAIASGSVAELETQIEIAGRLGYVDPEAVAASVEAAAEVGRMLAGLRRSLEKGRT